MNYRDFGQHKKQHLMQKQPHSAGGKSVGLVLYTAARTNTWVTVSPKVNLRGGYDVVSQALGAHAVVVGGAIMRPQQIAIARGG